MKITINQKVAAKAKGYYSHSHCLLATAIRAVIPRARVRARGHEVKVNGVWYSFSLSSANKLSMSYGRMAAGKAVVKKPFSVKLWEANVEKTNEIHWEECILKWPKNKLNN